ncbi:MAG: hypothetical protein KY456_00895 [Chloroflexi bacterium]|nr:hypothetical protein [Chloroflexota bacterium]
MRSAIIAVVVLTVLAGCGPMPETAPTPAPDTTLPTLETTATPATPAAAELTLGDLAQRVNAAWSGVDSYRVTFTGSTLMTSAALGTPVARPPATPGATPIATPGATPVARARETFVFVREVVLPDRQRQAVTGLGANDHEAVAIGNELFVRGPLVELIAPGTPSEIWIEIDPEALPEGAVISQMLGGLPQLPSAPLASLPARLLPQTVRESATVEHDGRECRVYGAADTVPATGMRVDYTIAIDDRDIPCFIETGAGGVTQGRDEYTDIDASLTIEPPVAATPVSVPPALATPLAHD